MAQKIFPCLWFNDQAEEAAKLYVSIFKNSGIKNISHYGKSSAEVSGRKKGSVMTVEFEIEKQTFLGLNGGPVFSFSPAISFFIGCETVEEVDRLYNVLSEKGGVLMPLDKYPFSERYAWINDRFGVSWQLFLGSSMQKITPCLMFTQKQNGKAREAMELYTSVFDRSKIETLVPYEKGEGEKDGALKHAVFSLEGEKFMAIDSGLDHKFSFTPAISFLVKCVDQAEIDRFWKNLSAVPEMEQCGWLQDRYGISWQIVPTFFDTMFQDKNPRKFEKAMKAMLQMKKLDLETLKKAYE